jgi:DNA replication and repair protein RecF
VRIDTISLINYRNHADKFLQFEGNVSCIVGNNGAGKTTILDAVYYFSMCKSYINPLDRQNVRFDQEFFVLQSEWQKSDIYYSLYCGVKLGGKKVFKKNKKEYSRLSDHIGQFPVVMISPYDTDLISEGSDLRRRWMDGIIAQFDRTFLNDLQRYSKVIEQRNALLKHQFENGLFQREPLQIWNEQLCFYGRKVYEKRKQFIEEFQPYFQKYYQWISQNNELVSIQYITQFEPLENETFEDILERNIQKDMRLTYSTVGAHRDDLECMINSKPIRKYGSQGQQKSFLIALRLAQFDLVKKHLNQTPVLLLDDIFDKLDNTRVIQLMRLVSDNAFSQVLITDTDGSRVKEIFEKNKLTLQLIELT